MNQPNTDSAPESTASDLLFRRVVVIGTPFSTRSILAEFSSGDHGFRPVGSLLEMAPEGELPSGVLGTFADLATLHAANPFTLAIVSLPRSRDDLAGPIFAELALLGIPERRIAPFAEQLGIGEPVRTKPAVRASIANGEIDMVDLIGRTPCAIDRDAVAAAIEGRRVMITGAGGSIGSEIARIAATFRPSQLVLMERSENALFEIDRQIARRFPGLARRAILHDVTDAEQTLRMCVQVRPQVVFHSAAHKHVPLMEDHPSHAVQNNVFGTKSIADAAQAVGAERFVMISSDKAVNPTSVMGATKRLAEMYVQALHRHSLGRTNATSFSMVRFGNVLGSACSVLPIWQAQLAEGGPLTVTDARMTRFFMTIHEAAILVIQSAAIDTRLADAASVYVLDMGEPVRILDLARRFADVHGFDAVVEDEAFEPDGRPRMDIRLTGARAGEKLFEELAYAAEALRETPFAGIHAWAGTLPTDFDVHGMIADLASVRHHAPKDLALAMIRLHCPEMTGGSPMPEIKGKPLALENASALAAA